MIAKEWRDARRKFAIAVVVVAVISVLASPILTPYEELREIAEQPGGYQISEMTLDGGANANAPGASQTPDEFGIPEEAILQRSPVDLAIQEMWAFYSAGGFAVLIPLAGLLGVTLISAEVSGGTISLLLSRPISRSRVLLTKYGVCAAVILVSAVLGSVLVVALAAFRGYPLGELSAVGITLSTVLLWLGSLFVLGVALLMSVLLRSVIASLVATALAVSLAFVFPGPFLGYFFYDESHMLGVSEEAIQTLLLPQYWYSESLYAGESLVPGHFLVSLVAAAVPLILALWIFKRRAY